MRLILPSSLSEYRCSSSSVTLPLSGIAIEICTSTTTWRSLASMSGDLELLDLHRRHVGEGLGGAGAAVARLHRRNARLWPWLSSHDSHAQSSAIRHEDEVDVAATERFIDPADDGEVSGGTALGGTYGCPVQARCLSSDELNRAPRPDQATPRRRGTPSRAHGERARFARRQRQRRRQMRPMSATIRRALRHRVDTGQVPISQASRRPPPGPRAVTPARVAS
jgi:hypothetical protein